MVIHAIVVDDEQFSRDNLTDLVGKYCRDIKLKGAAPSAAIARDMIRELRPHVVFLDINMPRENGFELVESLLSEAHKPLIVFVTAYDQHAIKAIRMRAFDYILKPIDIDELMACEERLLRQLDPLFIPRKKTAPAEITAIDSFGKIRISHAKGVKLLHLESIVYFEADNNYTTIHIKTDRGTEKLVVSRNLGHYEGLLPGSSFFRVHYSFIINLGQMKEYLNTGNGYVVMSNGTTIELSRRRGGAFRQLLRQQNKPAE